MIEIKNNTDKEIYYISQIRSLESDKIIYQSDIMHANNEIVELRGNLNKLIESSNHL
jgi:hypothetical protein